MSIAQELRTVGQGLETLAVEDFDLQSEGNGYFALGIPQPQVQGAEATPFGKAGALVQGMWRTLTSQNVADRRLFDLGPDVLRILFTPEGLLKLDAAGIAKRNPHAPGIPDQKTIGQILRIVGECLEAKSGRLLSIRKRRQLISFEYATRADEHAIEEWKIAELYELWLDASKRRQERATIVERKLQGERR